VNKNDNLGKRN